MNAPLCPCGRPLAYENCCGRFHRGEEPKDAETLMRSRFCAFVKGEAGYLHHTLHPQHEDFAQGRDAFVRAMKKHFSKHLLYKRLEVLDVLSPDEQGIEKVLFVAHVMNKGRDVSFAECSTFARDGVGIRYLAGRTIGLTQLGQNKTIALFERAFSG